MPRFIPVPWIRWQRFRVDGVVRERESGRPLSGLRVVAYDQDVVSDDYLGECETDEQGRFVVHFTDARFKDVLESRPDVYLCVHAPGADGPIADTSAAVRRNASNDEHYELEIPSASLPAPARPS